MGAILVNDRHILTTGYNQTPKGIPNCVHEDSTPCRSAVHAEMNALMQACKIGIPVEGSVCYSTKEPCFVCSQLLINAGITRVVYIDKYRLSEGSALLINAGIPIYQWENLDERTTAQD